MKISHLKTNRIVNPLGFALDTPTLSWVVSETADTVQTAAQVLVSHDAAFTDLVFDSGRRDGADIDSVAYRLPVALKPRTRYFWKVRVWGERESAESETAWFETAKMDEGWQAAWLTPDWDDRSQHPLLFHSFALPAKPVAARAYICGLGLYQLMLNDQKAGDEYLTPYCNAYDEWLQYQTFDITGLLHTGANRIAVMLGNGWYKGRYGANGGAVDYYGDRFALICELHITLENGEDVAIVTDTAWQAQPAPVLQSDIFDGETVDARISLTPSPETASGVRPIAIDSGLLEERRSLPVRVLEEITPVAVIHTPAGEMVLDMGQNMTGWLRFRTHAPAGTQIHLQFGEVLQGGNFFRDNLRTAKAEYHYIADGSATVVEPYFTFYGFRYVKISGWDGQINAADFTGCVAYSEMDITGDIETANPKVNQLFKNALWSQKGNFLDIPTDCPQRDERLGWTGDIQVFSGTACFNMDSAAFLSKYAYDLWLEQAKTGGMVPHIIPTSNLKKGGSAAWADVATVLPWNLYEFYGDAAILSQQFESMRAWVDYIHAGDEQSGCRRLWTEGEHFGDWLSLDASDPVSRKGGTPHDFIASAFYCYSAGLVAQAAEVLDRPEHAASYGKLAAEIKAAIQKEFFTATGRLAVPTQTGYVLALFMNLVPDGFRARVEADFIARIREDNTHLRTGFVGTPYLCRVLSAIGANDLAYKLLLNEDYPSWLYAVNLGATTIWERWNSINADGSISSTGMNSLNHYAYGAIVEWMYRDMCGLNPQKAGFRHASIAPKPDKSLAWAKATYHAAAGTYESGWQFTDDGYLVHDVTVPFNASAAFAVPQGVCAGDVLVNGQPAGNPQDIRLTAGRHHIKYRVTTA